MIFLVLKFVPFPESLHRAYEVVGAMIAIPLIGEGHRGIAASTLIFGSYVRGRFQARA
jgi:hypothetical protein